MKNLKIKSWLPMFEGFYNTCFDSSNNDYLINDLNDSYLLKEKGLDHLTDEQKEIIRDNYYDTDSYNNSIQEYQKEVIETSIAVVKDNLKDYITNIELEGLISPKEYNYYNDSINCKYEITEEQKDKIIRTIKENWDKWDKYISDKYKPCSGFIPYYDNDVNSDDWNLEEAIEHQHQLGVILEFLLKEVGHYTQEAYYYDVLENIYLYLAIGDIVSELTEKDVLIVTEQQKNLKDLKDNNATFDFKGVA